MPPQEILVFHGNKSSSSYLPEALREAGWKPIVVENGIDGLRLLCERELAVVIIDVGSAMQGQALCQCIKRISDVPVIMLSAKGYDEDIVRALEMGADDCVLKPVASTVLVAKVRACLRRMNWPKAAY